MESSVLKALSEINKLDLPWVAAVKKQLSYCLEVILKEAPPGKLEDLNIGLIAIHEINDSEPLHGLLIEIQYEMQRKYLPYAAKVRLNIYRR